MLVTTGNDTLVNVLQLQNAKSLITSILLSSNSVILRSTIFLKVSSSKSSSSSDTKAHTSGKQNSGTELKDYTAVEYKGLKDNDTIYIVFRKDGSGNHNDDRGYVLIPKV